MSFVMCILYVLKSDELGEYLLLDCDILLYYIFFNDKVYGVTLP